MGLRRLSFILAALVFLSCGGKKACVRLEEGELCIEPMAEDAIRVRLVPDGAPDLGELIFTETVTRPGYKVRKVGGNLTVSTAKMSAEYNAADDQRRSAEALRSMGAERLELFDYVMPKE